MGYWILALALLTFGVVTPWATRSYSLAAQLKAAKKARGIARQQEERRIAAQRRAERRHQRNT